MPLIANIRREQSFPIHDQLLKNWPATRIVVLVDEPGGRHRKPEQRAPSWLRWPRTARAQR